MKILRAIAIILGTSIIITALILGILITGSAFGAEVDTTRAVIHHTYSPDWGVERIRQIHVKENKWNDIGYHYIIRASGAIEEGRDIKTIGAHAKHRNHFVGIALTGYDQFSCAQIVSLIYLLKKLGVRHIEPHRRNNQTNPCPGPGLNINQIKKEIE